MVRIIKTTEVKRKIFILFLVEFEPRGDQGLSGSNTIEFEDVEACKRGSVLHSNIAQRKSVGHGIALVQKRACHFLVLFVSILQSQHSKTTYPMKLRFRILETRTLSNHLKSGADSK
jgi:hypothetical protein